MPNFKFKIVELTGIAASTPLHDGSNTEGYPKHASAFQVQASGGDVIIGDKAAVDADIGLLIKDGFAASWGNQESRGTDVNYDLSDIYVKSAAGSVILNLEVPTT